MSVTTETGWSDVAGLDGAKKALREIVVLPFKRPFVEFMLLLYAIYLFNYRFQGCL